MSDDSIHNFKEVPADISKFTFEELCSVFGESVAQMIVNSRDNSKDSDDLYVKEVDVKNKTIKLGFK